MYIRQGRNYKSLSSSQRNFSLSASPYDVAVEDSEVYIAVYGGNCIEVFSQNGQHIRTIGNSSNVGLGGFVGVVSMGTTTTTSMVGLGGKPAGLGINMSANIQFSSPSAIAVQGGVLYVVESGTCQVQKLTTTGKFISSFGTRGSGNGQLNNPRGICLNSCGCVFISECGNNRISVFEDNGTFLHHIVGNTADGSNLNRPWGLAFDHCGNLHVADTNTSTIKVFTSQGQYITQYNSGVNQPAGIAIDEEGNVFIADSSYDNFGYAGGLYVQQAVVYQPYGQVSQSNQVCILNSKHNIIHSFGINQAGAGITIDKEGSIYVCSVNNHQVHKF